MHKLTWQSVRLSLLAVTFLGTVLVTAKLAAAPKERKDQAVAQKQNPLPETVSMQDWQFVNSTPTKPHKEAPFGRQYRYQQGDRPLDVELQYMTSDGNVSRYLFVYTPVRTANAAMKIRYKPGVGHYGVLSHKGNAYLSACVNPRGESTVTEQQFTQNRYTYDLQASRLLPWLLGKESLIDRRCLWTFMSTPVKVNSNAGTATATEVAYKTLETTWFSWNKWWQSNFPPPS
jgi:cyanosortase A-associated protein